MWKTVESVTQGQSDKICDQVADAIVDEYLRRDKLAHVDMKVLGSHGMMMIGGEVSSTADFDIGALAKQVYEEIGYRDDLEVFVNIDTPSQETKRVTNGVTDQVMVHGYATTETREFLPRSVVYAHNLMRRLDDLRKLDPAFSWLKPDGKILLSLEADRVRALTLLTSHHVSVKDKDVQTSLMERLIIPLVGDDGVQLSINPIGSFTYAGFKNASGMSGRKTDVDLYGGLIPSGNSALSGKNPLQAGRCGTYMARAAARYVVEQGLVQAAMVSVVYTFGRAEPMVLKVIGMGEKSRGAKMDLTNVVKQQFDFRPEAIVERFDLQRPLYRSTSCYGQVGREGLPWEEPQ